MSPGGLGQPQASAFQARPNGRKQSSICLCGAGEHPGNVQMTMTYANLFRQTGARVEHKAYPGMNSHSFPPDFQERLPGWIDFLLANPSSSTTAPPRTSPATKPVAPVTPRDQTLPPDPPPTTPPPSTPSVSESLEDIAKLPPADALKKLRLRTLTTPAAKAGVKSNAEFPKVFGVLMDLPTKAGTVSIVCMSNGSAGLYSDKAAPISGGSEQPTVRDASIKCVKAAQSFHEDANPVSNFPIPSKGKVRVYLVGYSGVRMLESDAASLENGKGKFPDLWKECQAVMTELQSNGTPLQGKD
jgi:hypothetical protein